MPLSHLLFRCPACGHDPLDGEDDEVACSACGTRYRRAGPGARILVAEPGRAPREVPAWELTEIIDARGGAVEAALGRDGRIRHETRVTARWMVAEDPVTFRGTLLGFAERSTPEEEGTLVVTDEALTYRPDGAGPEPREWPLLEIRAVQTSSRSVQVRTPDGMLIQFEFPRDSPRRWDELLRKLIARRWRQEGRGEITEFQPRITTR